MCDPNPAPVAVDKECMVECFKKGDAAESCVECVKIIATCAFGKGSQPGVGETADDAFAAVESVVDERLQQEKAAPGLPLTKN